VEYRPYSGPGIAGAGAILCRIAGQDLIARAHQLAAGVLVDQRDPVPLIGRRKKESVGHPERFQNAALDVMDVILAADLLDDAAQRGDSHVAVAPARARFELQVARRVEADRLVQRHAHGAQVVAQLAIGIFAEARRVAHQLPDHGRVRGRMRGEVAGRQALLDHCGPEFGKVILDRAAQFELPFLDQHHGATPVNCFVIDMI
jgi:hypothetical protein